MPDPWPDPDGEKPDDWLDNHWIVFLALVAGDSYATAGKKVDRKPGTVSAWVQKWRARYGADFVRSPRHQVIAAEDRARGQAAAAERTTKKWAEIRAGAANLAAGTAEKAREVVEMGLAALIGDENRLQELTPRDMLDLARVAKILGDQADKFADIPDPTRILLQRNSLTATVPPPGTFDAFDSATDLDENLFAIMDTVITAFNQSRSDAIEAIEA